MAFPLSQEQVEFQETLRDFLTDAVSSELRRASRLSVASGASSTNSLSLKTQLWEQLESLGVRESFATEALEDRPPFGTLAIVAHECGRALVPEGFWETVFAGPYLWQQVLDDTSRKLISKNLGAQIGERLISGEGRATIAVLSDVFSASSPLASSRKSKTTGERPEAASQIEIPIVPWASSSQVALVIDPATLRVGFVALEENALSAIPLIDHTVSACKLSCDKSKLFELSPVASLTITRMAQTLIASEISGCLSRAIEMTVEYVKTREQFGVPVGGFQAVQQRLADMYVSSESVAALTRFASWSATASPEQFGMASLAALQRALSLGPEVLEGAIQLHGGIGFTHEFDLHLYLRRVKCLEAQWHCGEASANQLIEAAVARG